MKDDLFARCEYCGMPHHEGPCRIMDTSRPTNPENLKPFLGNSEDDDLLTRLREGDDLHTRMEAAAKIEQLREALDMCRAYAFDRKFQNDDATWKAVKTALDFSDAQMMAPNLLLTPTQKGKADD